VINEYVRTRRLRSSTEVVTDVVPDRPVAGCLEDRAADQAELWAAFGALRERQRAVLVLRYYEGLADREIAALLGCREASVRSLARRGLAAMRLLVAAVSTREDRT
jgi:RNA polymerase sigma factor (sigma-70 family)